jgi:ribonucleoside-triphosphate reductase (formate)
MTEGDAKGRVFTFPIPTYNIDKNFNFDDPRLEYLWKATAKYGLPYFANFVNSDLSPEDARSMCCRLRLDTRSLHHRGGGLFGANPLTGSIGVVTINLPNISHRTMSGDTSKFRARLFEVLEQAVESLKSKRKVLEEFTDQGLYPYSKYYLRSVKERTRSYWTNHFSTIGIIGLHEATKILFYGGDKQRDREFGLSVMDDIRAYLQAAQEDTGTLFNLEATPAEGVSYRVAKLDHERFELDGEPTCYTNSSQLPVDATSNPIELLDQQDEFQVKYTGGTVLHFWLGEQISDPAAVKQFVRMVCSNYKLPYFTLTPTFSVCPEHGYLRGKQEACPTCGGATEIYSRVVGYMRPVDQWNDGKRKEFEKRVMFELTPNQKKD